MKLTYIYIYIHTYIYIYIHIYIHTHTHTHTHIYTHTHIKFAVEYEEALYIQQKQDWELTVAQIMKFLLQNSDLN